LRSLTIPFAAAEDFELMAAPEARDLVALLDVLASQRHRLSLAHALRSPLFGASDDDLVALAGRAAGGDWWHALTSQAWDRPALQRAREWMPRWHAAAAQLPPHDLLDRIVAEGELHRRLAATVPPEQRLTACHAVDAVLEQALTLEGGRYATPYSFVRALKRKLIKVAAPAHSDAVQLLTVHGAKGLEAKVVFVLDADPQPQGVETATLLVDWPVDAERPRRCAFVYSEALCPPSLRDMLAAEVAARRREELNGLYVALTRARERLVVSATAPSRPGPGASWWERLEPLGAAWSPGPPGEQSTASGAAGIPDARVQVLPEWQGQIEAAPPADDTAATRLGQAVHRTLEWATSGAADEGVGLSIDELAAAAAEEFVAPAEAVARFARAILSSPACAPFFDPAGRVWAGNEVQVAYGGESLRIDRLVARTGPDGPVWWVLDYKINPAPQLLPENRLQLLRYRDAVRRLEPGASVRCAFISGDGKLIEIEG
jgi:ATP-dependent helicase/nuclease subunit A